MNKKIIIDIPLNSIAHYNMINNYKSLTKEWIDDRIDLFMTYTAPCIINQTDNDFLCVVHHLKETEGLVTESLNRYTKLPDNIIFSSDGDNLIRDSVKGYDYVYKLKVDSDNVIHPTFVEQLKKIDYYEGLQCIIGRCGYLYHTPTNRLALWDHDSSAFNAYTYKVEDYINNNYKPSTEPEEHLEAINLKHEFLYAKDDYGRSYVVIMHGRNLDNNFDNLLACEFGRKWCPGVIVDENIKKSILKDFMLSI